MSSPGISSSPTAKSMTRVRWSKLKLKGFVSAKGSRIKVTEFSAIARFVFWSVSSIGAAVLFGVIVKFGSEILKKILSMASTLMRAEDVGVLGIVIVAAPLLGMLDASVRKLRPPSTDSSTLTFAQLTGALDVFATLQVTTWFEPAGQVAAEVGCVTTNGPLLETTLTRIAPVFTPPPPEWLSRTVTRKVIVRFVVGNDSPNVEVPDKMSDNCGNIRVGFGTGAKDRKMGRLPLSVCGGPGAPRSNSSQQ